MEKFIFLFGRVVFCFIFVGFFCTFEGRLSKAKWDGLLVAFVGVEILKMLCIFMGGLCEGVGE